MSLSHDFGETTQAGKVLFHRAQRCREGSLRVRIEIGLAQKLLVGLLEVLNECLLVGLRIVDKTTQFIESLLTQTMEHYVNGSALLTYEQHSFSLRYVIGNEVCDRLGFTSAGRPLNDVTRAGSCACDSRSLCGVAGNDQVLLGQFQRWCKSF